MSVLVPIKQFTDTNFLKIFIGGSCPYVGVNWVNFFSMLNLNDNLS